MPDITLPNTFAASAVADPEDFMENLYAPNDTTPDSFEVINGALDDDNLPAGRQISRVHIQPNTFMVAGEVSSNAPLDFFDDFFATSLAETGSSPADTTGDFIAIPGACVAMYVPWLGDDCRIYATWNVTWLSDGYGTDECSVVRFGYRQPGSSALNFQAWQRRVCPQSVRDESSGTIFRGTKFNTWQGHTVLTPSKGWWEVGLFVASTALQCRVWNRAMRYIVIRRE